ncbi:MAG: beta-lactamase family protein [Candidatus Aminicenantes bacterium]|nr:beta-lactamase family protein [Candidatus Aminicenantes bacterium]
MKKHKRFPVFLFILFLIFSSGLPIPCAGFFFGLSDDDPFGETRTKILETLEKENIPSITVAVARGGKIIWEEGFGWANREKKIKATQETMYSLASISKPFTATGLLVLVERGLVDLNKPANHYLGEAKLRAFRGETAEATIQRLLHHTAGLPTHWNFFYEDKPQKRPSMEQSINRYGIIIAPPRDDLQLFQFWLRHTGLHH